MIKFQNESTVIVMRKIEKILTLAEDNNGLIKTSKIVKMGIRKELLRTLVDRDQLVKVKRGVYKLSADSIDDYEIIQMMEPKAIFSYDSALYLLKLSDRIPEKIHMTVCYDANVSMTKKKYPELVFHYVKPDFYSLGKIEIQTAFGAKICSYNAERTVLDIIKDRGKMDTQIFTDALKMYFNSNNKNILQLGKYAKKMGLESKLRIYTEVMLE